MHIEKGTLCQLNKDKRGFTMIEILVTIVVLAIITIPLLSYFSRAAALNANTRVKQNATVEAQNVLEKFKNASYDISDAAVVTAKDTKWSVKTPAAAVGGVYTLEKDENVDKSKFHVEAQVTPVKSISKNPGAAPVDYYSYITGSMDSKTDVMATEKAFYLSDAQLYFYGAYTAACESSGATKTLTADWFKNHLKRTMVVDARVPGDDSGADSVIVSVTNEYSCQMNGGSYPEGVQDPATGTSKVYSEVISSSKYKAADLKNIYLFFEPMSGGDEIKFTADQYFNTRVNAKQLTLYIVKQDATSTSTPAVPGATPVPVTSNMTITTSGAGGSYFALKLGKTYCNLTTTEMPSVGGLSNVNYQLYDVKDVNRIADITVTVKKGSTVYAQVTGSKAQN